jgi:hypothetical protein
MSCSIRARSSFISTSLSSRRVPNVPSSLCLSHSFASLGTLSSILKVAGRNNVDTWYEPTVAHIDCGVVCTHGMMLQGDISIVE